jgi:hypothetical protein
MHGFLRPLRHERHARRCVGDVDGFARPVMTTDNGQRSTDCEAGILASAAS